MLNKALQEGIKWCKQIFGFTLVWFLRTEKKIASLKSNDISRGPSKIFKLECIKNLSTALNRSVRCRINYQKVFSKLGNLRGKKQKGKQHQLKAASKGTPR